MTTRRSGCGPGKSGAVGFLRKAKAGSVLDPGLDGTAVPAAHRRLLRYARRVMEDLAEGAGWDAEYPRDTWKLRRLGISGKGAEIRFGDIPQPWLKDLAKRWARWRLSTGVPGERAQAGIRAVTRLAGFLAARDVTALAQVDRALLERYLADLHREFAGRDIQGKQTGQLAAFLADTRRHGWDAALPPDAVLYPEDSFPARSGKPSRTLTLPDPLSNVVALAAGPAGTRTVWFADFGTGDAGEITPAGRVMSFAAGTPASGLSDITAGPDGAMWVSAQDGIIARVTTEGAASELALPSPGSNPDGIAAGPGKSIWVTETGSDAIVEISLR